jgi:hypothetical protein
MDRRGSVADQQFRHRVGDRHRPLRAFRLHRLLLARFVDLAGELDGGVLQVLDLEVFPAQSAEL